MSAPLAPAFATLALDDRVARRMERYVRMLLQRNVALNLTGAKDIESAADHVRDSLRLLPYVSEPLIDIGSGGGFPAIPLAIASGMRVTLVESLLKKARFLAEVASELELPVAVRAVRAEDAARTSELREVFASATARAVASVTTVIELTVPFLRVGGLAVLQRGQLSGQERAAAADAALVLGARVEGEIALEAEGDKRCLLLVRKTEATGQRFRVAPVFRPSGRCVGSARMPDPEWIDERLASALPPNSLYAVGGRVRDELRSQSDGRARVAKDLDYVVVGVAFDELIARLQPLGPTNVVGASFSVVKVALGGSSVDVALPRRERSTGVGHRQFEVESGPAIPLADDLGRRDFRMNMIARALPAGEVVDPYGGAHDIAAGRIDILREAAFEEDPLRMLRAAQFAARFEFALSPRTRSAIEASARLVTSVSPERVRDELIKLVELAERPSIGLEIMRETGLLDYVLPELIEGVGVEQNEFHRYDVYRHNLASVDATPPGDLVLRLATLLHDVGKPRTKDGPHFYGHEIVGAEMTRELLDRLRFSSDQVAQSRALVKNHMYATGADQKDGTLRRFIRKVGVELLPRQFALRHADIAGSGLPKRGEDNERFEARVAELLARKPALAERDLALSGLDVIAELIAANVLPPGSRGGPLVGVYLRRLLEVVYDDPDLNQREELLAILRLQLASQESVEAR